MSETDLILIDKRYRKTELLLIFVVRSTRNQTRISTMNLAVKVVLLEVDLDVNWN